jgi:putative hemolysin
MKISIQEKIFFPGLFALSLLAGCGAKQEESQPSVAIANPASAYCVKKGGKIEIVKEDAGERGMCRLPDGTVVDEWELFRSENPQ